MTRSCAAGVLALAMLADARAEAQAPSADELLSRMTAYVQRFVEQFSNVVAEERYVQETIAPRRRRVLTSDFLLVTFPGSSQWHAFRDVFEVDGKPVREREDRLTRLFLEPPADATRRANEMAAAGAQYNLLNIGTLNNPLLAMAFLQDIYRDRIRLIVAGRERSLGPDVRTVQFQEWRGPTLLRGTAGNLPARGLIWVEESTGRIVKTEFRVGGRFSPTRVVTSYTFDEQLQMNVPAEMRDWYPSGRNELSGVATYGRFRQFQVHVAEELK